MGEANRSIIDTLLTQTGAVFKNIGYVKLFELFLHLHFF